MKTDIEIARESKMKDISEILDDLDIKEYEKYGNYKAKVDFETIRDRKDKAKLVLVTAINPTPLGEGKTTMNIGLSMALNKIGYKSISVLREPSLGPSFGIKGGAAGGGYSQVVPMEDINLHFTGDFHAITSAVNLVASLIDNHIYFKNTLNIDPSRIIWRRCLDLNDRSLREVVVGLGKRTNGFTRQDGFDITAASELMAVFCLAKDTEDLREKVSKMVIGYTYDNEPVFLEQLHATGAVLVLLKDAIKPNFVQTLENTPAIIHGGPFANIAHGCNSVIATRSALKLCDFAVTEAGFGADLGAEKFFDIKCNKEGLKPNVTVIVASVRALKYHGGADLKEIEKEDLDALKEGFENLRIHIENMKKYGPSVVVAINKFDSDTENEIKLLIDLVESTGIKAIETDVFHKGSEGAIELAKYVKTLSEKENDFTPLYDNNLELTKKIEKVAHEIYRADGVVFSSKALKTLKKLQKDGYGNLPICVAKTQYSLSDDKNNVNPKSKYDIHVSDVKLSNGAGFVVVYTGDVMTMPGLPKVPASENIDIDEDGNIVGLF
ncbi:MAG: formate--tetrahydrofolate ligase [Peptoniphilaceae bacterium]|nr:formate--tetrahydrofolate ligase [Peptoniphilaceae bacterium]MDD7383865.1 formate--tetrahydrofolate ligase [Peptoniphilaceae bacterium]MDY3738006.1 formate--tetrahydrofolate ligase [Peptoniphilaceae bacterium]